MSDPIVVDASVALKWVLDEDMTDLARRLASKPLTAPDLLLSECANGLWRWVRLGVLSPEIAETRFAALRRAPVRLRSAGLLLEQALRLAIDLNHPVYDCLYLSLAIGNRTRLVSADQRFVRVVRRHADLADAILFLGETAH